MTAARIALVGGGAIAVAKHLPALKAAGARVEWLIDPGHHAEHLAAEWDIPRVSAQLADALEDPSVDAVDICTPHHLHAAQTIASIQAGKHVLVEKPAAMNVSEMADIVRAEQRADVVVAIAENYLLAPATVRAKALIEDGAIGIPHLAIGAQWMASSIASTVAGRPPRVDTGVIHHSGVHMINTLGHLMGPVARVGAMSLTADAPASATGPIDTDMVINFHFRSGAIGSLTITGRAQISRPGPRSFTVVGELGTLTFDPFARQVVWTEGNLWEGTGVEHSAPINSRSQGHDEVILDFLGAMRSDVPPASGLVNHLHTHAVIDAIVVAADSGRVVDVAEPDLTDPVTEPGP